MEDTVPVEVTWNLTVTTNAEVPEHVWERGPELTAKYIFNRCEVAGETKTRVAGGFIVGEAREILKKEVVSVTEARREPKS